MNVSVATFAADNHVIIHDVTFHGLNNARAVQYNGYKDTDVQHNLYCIQHNPTLNQFIDIQYHINLSTKNGYAEVLTYPGKPMLHPIGLANMLTFMSDGKYGPITRIIFSMNNDTSNPGTIWMTLPEGKNFQCVFSSKSG